MAVKRCKNGDFTYNVNDLFIGRSLDLYGEWCEKELEVLQHFIQPGALVLDIGANIGTHTIAFAKRVGRQGTVVAFEPQRLSHQTLCANVALNALDNVVCLQNAVGNVPGHVLVPVLSPDRENNLGGLSLENQTQGEQVAVMTVDAMGLKRCDLIKIDVEGMERQVLLGAADTIGRLQPALFVENNSTDRAGEILGTVFDLGYECWWHIASYFNPDNFFQNPDNVFADFQPEANMLCLPKTLGASIDGAIKASGPDDNWLQAVKRAAQGGA